jgi:hypothetical protein
LNHHNRTAVSVILPIVLPAPSFSLSALYGRRGARATPRVRRNSPPLPFQIEPVDPGDLPIPPEFRMAIYENLIAQIRKTGKFQHVYGSGDKDAASASDLVTLRTTAQSFTKGSQRKLEVTTFRIHLDDPECPHHGSRRAAARGS